MTDDGTNHADDEYFDELQQELAELENALDLDDDDALFAMLDEIHERNVEELEEVDESDDKDALLMPLIPSARRFEDDILESVDERDEEKEQTKAEAHKEEYRQAEAARAKAEKDVKDAKKADAKMKAEKKAAKKSVKKAEKEAELNAALKWMSDNYVAEDAYVDEFQKLGSIPMTRSTPEDRPGQVNLSESSVGGAKKKKDGDGVAKTKKKKKIKNVKLPKSGDDSDGSDASDVKSAKSMTSKSSKKKSKTKRSDLGVGSRKKKKKKDRDATPTRHASSASVKSETSGKKKKKKKLLDSSDEVQLRNDELFTRLLYLEGRTEELEKEKKSNADIIEQKDEEIKNLGFQVSQLETKMKEVEEAHEKALKRKEETIGIFQSQVLEMQNKMSRSYTALPVGGQGWDEEEGGSTSAIPSVKQNFCSEEIAIILETAKREASHKSKLRIETLQFLDTLHGYLVCRGKMDAKYAEIDEFQIIAKHEMKADGSEMYASEKDPLMLKPQYQQQSLQGRSVETLSELYEAAEQTKPIYQEIVNKVVRKLRAKHQDEAVGVTVKLCDLKGQQRAQEKAEDDYSKRRPSPGVSWLYDIVRGSVELTSAQHVIAFLDLIQQEPSVRIIKAKNRFTEPSLTGYRDLNIQFQVHTGKGFYHTCELQIHHKAIKELDVELHTHMYYEFFRSYFAGATASLKERLEVLKLISAGGAIDDSFLKELLETSSDAERLERLGVLFRDQLCEYQWAFRVFVRLFEIQKERYGILHPSVAGAYNDMALVLKEQGKLDEAMELYKESLKIYKATYEDAHPSVSKAYFNMALVLKEQDNLVEAMGLFEKSLFIDIDCNGKESFSVANTYTHMAAVLRKQGKLDEAMDLFQKSLDSKKRLAGDSDSSIVDTLQNIAIILKQKGRLKESENLFQESIDIATKSMGENHSSVAVGYRNMALVLEKQGKLSGALELYTKSLDIYRKNVGEKHLLVADIYSDMAYSYKLQGDKGNAKGLLLKSFSIKKKLFVEHVIEAGLRKKIANQRRSASHIGPLTPRVVTA